MQDGLFPLVKTPHAFQVQDVPDVAQDEFIEVIVDLK
jgi:hypothetical protein